MISVEEAIELVLQHSASLEPLDLAIEQATNLVLAEDIQAPISLPPFQQSAMDGYAIGKSADLSSGNQFKLIGEAKAGDSIEQSLNEGEAMRIFTGAMVPEGAIAVIMQEVCEAREDKVIVQQEIKVGSNIRPIGEQMMEGDLALEKGALLNPAAIGFLISLGLARLKAFPLPKLSLIVTGNELVEAGQSLKPGQIYESNSGMLSAALSEMGIQVTTKNLVSDDLDSTVKAIEALMQENDILILSGGISVGDYDYVSKALRQLQVEELFYKVNQKPGKPLFFGKKDQCLLFALPGNPAAALTCFYQYVLPAVHRLSGKQEYGLKKKKLLLKDPYVKKGNRAQFLKARMLGEHIELLEGQSSAMLYSFARANALVYLPADQTEFDQDEEVVVYLLP